MELAVGEVRNGHVRFAQDGPPIVTVDLEVTERVWPVTDEKARAAAFREEMGEDVDEWWCQHAQWYINEEKNAAALAIFRPKTPDGCGDLP